MAIFVVLCHRLSFEAYLSTPADSQTQAYSVAPTITHSKELLKYLYQCLTERFFRYRASLQVLYCSVVSGQVTTVSARYRGVITFLAESHSNLIRVPSLSLSLFLPRVLPDTIQVFLKLRFDPKRSPFSYFFPTVLILTLLNCWMKGVK